MTPSETQEAANLAAQRQHSTPIGGRVGGDDTTDDRNRRRFTTTGGFSLKRTFLVLLLIACLAAAVWTGYLLFTDRTNPIVGTIILLADIGVLIWNISVLKRYRAGTGSIVSILLVIVILGVIIGAFSGVEPFSTAKDGLVAWFQERGGDTPQQEPPLPSEYPADISGHVTIAEQVRAATAIPLAPYDEGYVFWIVDFTVRNVAYSEALVVNAELGYRGWEIIAENESYLPRLAGIPERASIAPGQTGRFMLHFSVPGTLQINDAQICYLGQEPYSYGELTGGDRITAYDWDSREPIPEYEGPGPYEGPVPHGLYSSVFGDLDFETGIVTAYNFPILGKSVYVYEILDQGTKIQLTDVVTNEAEVYGFKYSEEYGYVVITWGGAGSITYWRE